jgi:hypothetical protein
LIFINLGCEDQWRYAPYLKARSNGSRDHPCDDGGEQNPRYHDQVPLVTGDGDSVPGIVRRVMQDVGLRKGNPVQHEHSQQRRDNSGYNALLRA